MRGNYFFGSPDKPYHVSIGGLVFDAEGRVLVHHFTKKQLGEHYLEDLYILMRETIEPGESIEEALRRGLMEEFGLEGELLTYIGSIRGHYPREEVQIEKTTLYFLVRYDNHRDDRRLAGSAEAASDMEWHAPDFLISQMKLQGKANELVDESPIIERFVEYFNRQK